MTVPLSAAKLAELRRLHDQVIAEGWNLADAPVLVCAENAAFLVAANNAMTQLLDEVKRRRSVDDLVAKGLVAGCPHGGVHAGYCAGCCAQFDPGRMVLRHEVRCQFRGHERAER